MDCSTITRNTRVARFLETGCVIDEDNLISARFLVICMQWTVGTLVRPRTEFKIPSKAYVY